MHAFRTLATRAVHAGASRIGGAVVAVLGLLLVLVGRRRRPSPAPHVEDEPARVAVPTA